jgi:hypothetical protein
VLLRAAAVASAVMSAYLAYVLYFVLQDVCLGAGSASPCDFYLVSCCVLVVSLFVNLSLREILLYVCVFLQSACPRTH